LIVDIGTKLAYKLKPKLNMKKLTRYYCGNGEGMFESKTGHWIEYAEHLLVIKELNEQLHKLSVGGGLLPKCPNCQGTGIDPTIPNDTKLQ